jgi:diguanylate cyclase (GGDEF)-like protein
VPPPDRPTNDTPEAAGGRYAVAPPRPEAGTGIARRSRAAGIGVAVVLSAVSVFAVWSARAGSTASAKAESASRISDDFARAATAVAAEESLERKYRLEPSPDVRTRYNAAATALVTALGRARVDGSASDAALVRQLLTEHDTYLAAIGRMFAAIDRNDVPAYTEIDAKEADPSYAVMEKAVLDEAAEEHSAAVAQLHSMRNLERVTSRLTPIVFMLGLMLAAWLTSVTRAYRRMLLAERGRAVHDSMHDALTGLPNRALLADRLAQALHSGKRNGTKTALLVIDLDRFKEINDTFGHHYGDELLTQVGPRLAEFLRASDSVSRLGGDEFAVLLPDVGDVAAAEAIAAKLHKALETPFRVEGIDLDVEGSIGIVLSGEHGENPTTLLQRADIAMYVAKAQNLGVFAYDPDTNGNSPARLALLGELRQALDHQQLVVHYQPKVSISTGEVIGAEALVRWLHPTRGLVYPDAFIPVAEHTGLIGPLTQCVLTLAVTQARIWMDAGQPLPIAVNLSARNLLDERLPDQIDALLSEHGVPASLLKLEVTESAIMTEPARAGRLLRRLANLGIGISIDDFGAGYTSLGQLKTLPVTELKVDRSFVTTMTEDPSDALIVHSVVDLGHNLGLTIVAEGVETPGALSRLAAFGCDVAQGYHWSRPVPIEEFDAWREEHTQQTAATEARDRAKLAPI